MKELNEKEIIKNAKEMIINAEEWLQDEEYSGAEEQEWAKFEKNTIQAEHIQNINKRNENQRMQLKLLQEKNKELQKENYPMFFERGICDKLEELLEE